jgi:polar amino acid transport system substrate-binding protein
MSRPVLACLLLLTAMEAGATRLFVTTEQAFPGAYMENGKLVGHGTEKVREIMRRTGIAADIEMMPWKRALTQAQTQNATCVYSTTRTPEREALFKWVGPLIETDWVLYGRSGRQYNIKTLDDARGLRIGVYNGDVRGDYLAARGYRIETVQNDDSNPKKILAGRIDLWATGPHFADEILARTGLEGQIVPVLTFNHVQLYLACNPSVPDALVEKMQAALTAMHADGTVRSINQKYERRPPN